MIDFVFAQYHITRNANTHPSIDGSHCQSAVFGQGWQFRAFSFFFFSKWHPWTKIIFKNEILRVPSFRSLVTQYYWRRKTLHQTQLISLLGSKAIRFKIHHACQSLVPIWRPFCITDWHREGLYQNTKKQIHARYSTHTFK